MISSVSSEQHLGHIIGNQVSQECIKSITNDFIKRVNVLSAVFKFTFSETKYSLFKVFCMSLYGSVLWNFSSKHVEMFYTTWHKCIRRLLGLPCRTHNNLLHLICNDIPVDGQLHLRFLNFFVNHKSDNTCVKLCALLCLRGSRSEASNSLDFITTLYSMDKYNIVDLSFTNTTIGVNSPISADMMSAGAIIDVLCMRNQKNTNFMSDELNQLLSFFCLDN